MRNVKKIMLTPLFSKNLREISQ